jgi:hypothetical protein
MDILECIHHLKIIDRSFRVHLCDVILLRPNIEDLLGNLCLDPIV